MIASLVRTLPVVMDRPFAADVVQVSLSHDHESVEAFDLQTSDESLDVRPQIRGERGVALDLRSARLEHLVELRRELRVVVSHHVLRGQFHAPGVHQEFLCLLEDLPRIRGGCAERNPAPSRPQVQEHQEVQFDEPPYP